MIEVRGVPHDTLVFFVKASMARQANATRPSSTAAYAGSDVYCQAAWLALRSPIPTVNQFTSPSSEWLVTRSAAIRMPGLMSRYAK